ncbi:hypothetical protein QCA50_000530 [Cerrena zonata]|uniref:Piwi domain-containing protein n=1 Tax=Cerrena zonata TaxID=2478898 RepID=A0AAW0GT95_9APHY
MTGRGAPRGRGRGAPILRGGPSLRGAPARVGLPNPGDHVSTVGVKRSGFGRGGHPTEVFTNHYEVSIPQGIIYHYDGIAAPQVSSYLYVLMKSFSLCSCYYPF